MNKMRALFGAAMVVLAGILSSPALAQSTLTIPQVTVAGVLQRWTGMTLGGKNVGTIAIVDASGNQITTFAISAASLPLPALAATSTKQSDGTQKTQIVDGSGNVIGSTSNNLNIQCANCSGSGVSTADAATFTASTSLFAGTGGFYQTTATSNPLTNGKQGMWQMTANRAGFVNLRDASGNELGVAAAPVQVSLANTGANGTAVAVSLASVPSHAVTNAGTFATQSAVTAASSSYAAGAFSAGVGVDGWDLTQGSTSDAAATAGSTGSFSAKFRLMTTQLATVGTNLGAPGATVCATDTGSCSINALFQRLLQGVTTLNTNVTAPIPSQARSVIIGGVGLPTYETPITPGTAVATQAILWGVQYNSTQATFTNGQQGTPQISSRGALYVATGADAFTAAVSNLPTTVDVNSGNKSASTLRVVLATDQPALTNKLLVTPDSVALPANQSVNVSQINGVTALMGNGVTGTGSQRVTIASDNTAFSVNAVQSGTWNVNNVSGTVSLPTGAATAAKQPALGTAGSASTDVITVQGAASMTKLLVTPDANSAVNVAQINGVAALMGNGVTGTGSQRVTIASDNTAFSVNNTTQAGELHIGEVGSNQIKVQVAQTVTASAYSAGNALGGLMTIANAARVSGSAGAAGTGGIVTGMQLNSKAIQSGVQVDVFFFDANPSGSTCTDKSAFVLANADFDKVVGIMTIPSTAANGAGWFGATTTGAVGIPTYFPVTYDLASATSIYACAVVRAAITPGATSDISFKFNMLRN